MKKVLRMRDVIAKLGLSRSTIHRLQKAGQFVPAVQLSSRAVGFYEDDLDEWLEKRLQSTE
ncbi:MAG: AlpA family phage regulatory protein [Burkholderiales bacterium]|nr:AlpA family phage regulatory protein [Burkholderiales bacterium]MDR4517924.1 AlpA family phage regulatory protein [Nitrosomonas sp.]